MTCGPVHAMAPLRGSDSVGQGSAGWYQYINTHANVSHCNSLLTNALMEVLSQCIAISTFTIIAANLIVADVVTTAIVSVTLIDI